MPAPEAPNPSQALVACLDPELFRALADPTRLQLVARLTCGSRAQTVTEVAGCCGVHLSGVSRHLAALRRAGVVRAERCGREVRYSLEGGRLAAALRGMADAIEAGRAAGEESGDACTGEGSCGPAATPASNEERREER